jgi:hypothetical protein
MALTAASRIWNRAALDHGGPSPAIGDAALASMLRVHGLAMNGGITHAVEVLGSEQSLAGARGYAYFGLSEAAALLQHAVGAAESESEELDERYGVLIPNDGAIAAVFARRLLSEPACFSPLSELTSS